MRRRRKYSRVGISPDGTRHLSEDMTIAEVTHAELLEMLNKWNAWNQRPAEDSIIWMYWTNDIRSTVENVDNADHKRTA